MAIMKMGYKYANSNKIIPMPISQANEEALKVYTVSLPEFKSTIYEYSNHEIEIVVGEKGYGRWEIRATEKYDDYTINEIIHEFFFEARKDIKIIHIAIDVTTNYVLISYKENPYYINLQFKKPKEPYIVFYTDNNYETIDIKKCKDEEELCKFMIRCENKKNREIDEIIYIDRMRKYNIYSHIKEIIKEEKFKNSRKAKKFLENQGLYIADELMPYIRLLCSQ